MKFIRKYRDLLGIVGFTMLLYGITFSHSYSLDDEYATAINPQIQKGIKGIPEIFTSSYINEANQHYEYRPVVKATFAIEYSLFGNSPATGHVINVLLYFITGIVLLRLLRNWFRNYPDFFPLLVTLLFLAHPIHTEVVASLKNRDEILAFLFSLLALSQAVRFAQKPAFLPALLSFLFLFTAYWSKASTMVFVAIIPLCIWFFNLANWKRVLLIFVFLLISVWLARNIPKLYLPKPERVLHYFENPLFQSGDFASRLSLSLTSLWYYIKLLVLPHPLVCYYGYATISVHPLFSTGVIISGLLHLLLFVFGLRWTLRRNPLGFAVLFYLIAVSVFSNLVRPAMGIVAERYVYAATFGFVLAVAVLLFRISGAGSKNGYRPARPVLLFSLSAIILILYTGKTMIRAGQWKNHRTLFEADLPKMERSVKGMTVCADWLLRESLITLSKTNDAIYIRKDIELMENLYSKAIEIYPDNPYSLNNYAFLKLAFFKDYKSAIPLLQKALRHKPDYNEAQYNLAYCFEKSGLPDSAVFYYRLSMRSDPDGIKGADRLAGVLMQNGNGAEACNVIKELIQKDPRNNFGYVTLARYHLQMKDTASAVHWMEEGSRNAPGNKELDVFLANYFLHKGDSAKSVIYRKRAGN